MAPVHCHASRCDLLAKGKRGLSVTRSPSWNTNPPTHFHTGTYRFFVIFHRYASFAQTFCNSNSHHRRGGIADKDGTARIQRRIKVGNRLQGGIIDLPKAPGSGRGHLSVFFKVAGCGRQSKTCQQTGTSRACCAAGPFSMNNCHGSRRNWPIRGGLLLRHGRKY